MSNVTIRPEQPVGKDISDCRSLLAMFSGEIEKALPKHVSVDLLMKAALNSVRKNPKLLECTKVSMLSSLMFCAESGLMPDTPAQECHLIPFRVKGVMTVNWIPGFRGLHKLARQSGEVGSVEARAVYEKDEFRYHYGLTPDLHHVPYEGTDDPGPLTYAYAVARFKSIEVPPQFDVMPRVQIEKIRASSKQKDGVPWTKHVDEMGKKSAFKRLSKWLPLSPELRTAIALDTAAEVGDPQPMHDTVAEVVAEEPSAQTSTENLADDLAEQAGTTDEPLVPPKVQRILDLIEENKGLLSPAVVKLHNEKYLRENKDDALDNIYDGIVKKIEEAQVEKPEQSELGLPEAGRSGGPGKETAGAQQAPE